LDIGTGRNGCHQRFEILEQRQETSRLAEDEDGYRSRSRLNPQTENKKPRYKEVE